MEIDFEKYISHYFEMPSMLIFFGLSIAVLAVMYVILIICARRITVDEPEDFVWEYKALSDEFFEIIFCGGSIILFIAIYYLINRFVLIDSFRNLWDKYNDFLLLLLMILSIAINSFFGLFLFRRSYITKDEKSTIRLLGMLYMILIFMYIKFIYEDNNYDMFITYFLTLMIGRFVYFDASLKDFINSVNKAFKKIPLMLLALFYTGIMCLYGFTSGYLLKHNGVITNIFFAHLFMCVAIWLTHFIPEIIVSRRS